MNDVVTNLPHATGKQPEVLYQILDHGVNLSLWQRSAQTAITRELSSLKESDLPDLRCTTTLDSFADDVITLLQQQGLDSLAFSHWRIDLHRLAEVYFSVSKDRDVTMRLETTNDDACRRFHADNTQLRLLCTYRGPGTQWLNNEQVDRMAQSNDDIIRFGEPSEFMPFWVGILKGNSYPGNKGHGLVHRSPSIAGSGQTRVIFCLDC